MNAGHSPNIAFERCITPCPIPTPRNNSDQTTTDNHIGHSGGDNPNNDNHSDGNGPEDRFLGEPDNEPPDDDAPENLADVISTIKAFLGKNSRFCAFLKICASFQLLYDGIFQLLPTSLRFLVT